MKSQCRAQREACQAHLLLDQLHLHERVAVVCGRALFRGAEVEGEDVPVLWRRAPLALRIKPRRAEGAPITHWVMALGVAIQ